MGEEDLRNRVPVDVDVDEAVKVAKLLGFKKTASMLTIRLALAPALGGTPHFNHNPDKPRALPARGAIPAPQGPSTEFGTRLNGPERYGRPGGG